MDKMRKMHGFVFPMGANSLLGDMFDDDAMKALFTMGHNSDSSKNMMSVLTGSLKSDIKESETSFVVETEVPGYNKEDINVEIEDGVLTISVETKKETEESTAKYIRRERVAGKYSRSFTFEGVDESAIKAKYDKGILTIELPKVQKSVAKKGINID